jgi:hypothetical protein
MYFLQISLTGTGGEASNQFNAIFTGANAYWCVVGTGTAAAQLFLAQALQQAASLVELYTALGGGWQ